MSSKVVRRFRQLRNFAHLWVRPVVCRIDGMHRIRSSGRICNPTAAFSIHMVTCHSHLEMALWCLKSFTYFAELSPPITIHDDGSLTEKDKRTLRDNLARCTIIDKEDADQKMDRVLENHPHCRRMRQAPRFHCSLKLFDPWVYAAADVVLLIDSDVLFFQRPEELLACADGGTACFNSDYQSAYAVDSEELGHWLGVDVLGRVNAGLLVLARGDYDLDLIERYFAFSTSSIPNLNRHEQTVYAILLSRCSARRLSEAYQISKQPIGATTVSHHFVSDGSRLHFSTRGVKTLRRRGILV